MSLRTKKDTFNDVEGIFEQAQREEWEEMWYIIEATWY